MPVHRSGDADRRVTAGAWSESGTNHQQTWGYDANGNVLAYRTFANGVQKSITSNQFDAQNRTTYTDTDGQVSTRRYDRSGRNTQMVMNQGGKTYYYNYSYFGDGRERSVAGSGGASGGSTSSYDANKVRVYVNLGQGDGQNRAETKSMVIDNEGHILSLDHDDGKSGTHELRSYAYANGNPVGETGHGVDGTQSVELDSGSYSLVKNLGSDTPTPAITSYTAHDGDSLQGIAAAVYGNPSLWFVIADANGLNPGEPIKAGTQLKIPNSIQQGQFTSETHALYNESDIVGSTLPNLKSPPPPSSGGCGSIIMIIIVVVIAVVVAFFTAGAGLLLVNAVMGTAYASLAAAAAGSFLLQSGESYWSLAKQQLGPDATNADIQRQVYALMELNPGLDPRTLQIGQSINLIGPNSGTTISAGTLAAYGASDAEYQTYREEQARVAAQNVSGGSAASVQPGASQPGSSEEFPWGN
jgi:YD repeat-containing protein